jgi:hypothetical protein
MTSARASLIAGLLLAVFALLEAGSLRHMTLTKDEDAHYRYGWQILNRDSTRFDDSKMPFSALNALPRLAAEMLRPGSLTRRLETVQFGRYVTVLSGMLLGWLVFRWTLALYGAAAGLLAVSLYVFDPNILAHSGLVTTDLYAAWMIALAVWSFWRFLNHEGPGWWRAATISAVTFGLAQLAKYSAAYLVPIFLLLALGHALPDLWALARAGQLGALVRRGVTCAKVATLYVGVFLIIVHVGYWGQKTFQPLAACRFESRQFQHLQAALSAVPALRVPVPWAYIQGMDMVLERERAGTSIHMLGQLGRDGVPGRRFPEYYAVAWLFKEPIATQLLLYLALGAYLARFRRFDFRRNEWFLACPVLFFAWYLTFVFNLQIGFRFALPVLPFVFVFTGSLASEVATMRRGFVMLIGALLLYLAASTLSYYPHFIPYFNELVWDRTKAYRIMADSNLGWSQNLRYVRRYLRRHPDTIEDPEGPQAGTIVTSVNKYVGLTFGERYRWLRENFEPVDHIAYGHLIFRVTPEALRRVTDPLSADWADQQG